SPSVSHHYTVTSLHGSRDRCASRAGASRAVVDMEGVRVLWLEFLCDVDAVGSHGSHDLGAPGGDEAVQAVVVVVEVEGDAQQRLAPCVLVHGVEVQELVLVGQALALDPDTDRAVPVASEILLPLATPLRAGTGQAADLACHRRAAAWSRTAIAVAVTCRAVSSQVEYRQTQRACER